MNRLPRAILPLLVLPILGMTFGQPAHLTNDVPALPKTPAKPVTHTYQGTLVTDPYEWLEQGGDGAVREWTERQNHYTRALLDRYPVLPALRAQIKGIVTARSMAYHDLQYRGNKLFALKFQPPKEQGFLITLASADEPESEHIVVDPNQIDAKAKTTIDFYVPSLNGKLVGRFPVGGRQ
jgi:prolyl oligopeptidase